MATDLIGSHPVGLVRSRSVAPGNHGMQQQFPDMDVAERLLVGEVAVEHALGGLRHGDCRHAGINEVGHAAADAQIGCAGF